MPSSFAPQEHLIELLRAHFVGSTWICESLLAARNAEVAIQNEADMFGYSRSGADLSTEPKLIELIEEGCDMR